VWFRDGACDRFVSMLVALNEFSRPFVSNGAPIKSSFGVGSGSCEVARLPNSDEPTIGEGVELWSREEVELPLTAFDCARWCKSRVDCEPVGLLGYTGADGWRCNEVEDCGFRKEGRVESTEGGGCFVRVPRRGFRLEESPSMMAGGSRLSVAQFTLDAGYQCRFSWCLR
jgi:hypothetical protein